MQKRTLSSLAACFLIGACASGTPIPEPTPAACKFAEETLVRIKAAGANLPQADSGDLFSLRLNRQDSKQAHRDLWIDAQALAREVEICKALQTKAAAPQGSSKLDKRIEKLQRKEKP